MFKPKLPDLTTLKLTLVKGYNTARKLVVDIFAYFGIPSTRTKHQSRVLEFNRLAGVPRPDVPSIPDPFVRIARARLIMEEALEVTTSMGVSVSLDPPPYTKPNQLEFGRLYFDADEPEHVADIAKEFADLHVVTTGSEQAFGIDLKPIQDAVDINNLGKFGPGSYTDQHGKLRKPPGYPKPDIASLLLAQGWHPGTK